MKVIKIINKIRDICKRKYCRIKNFKIYKPVNISISRKAKIYCSKSLIFNKVWNNNPHNRLGGIYIDDNATVNIKEFTFRDGCRVSVSKGAKLTLGSGYMNNDGAIYCRNSITIGENVIIAPDVIFRDSDEHKIGGGIVCANRR